MDVTRQKCVNEVNETLSVPLFCVSDVFLTDGSRVSAATVASTAIAAAQWAVTQVPVEAHK